MDEVYVVTERLEHDIHENCDGKDVIGVYADKRDAIDLVNRRFTNECEGRDLHDDDGWTDNNGGFLRDHEDECELVWSIEPYVIW